jgi:hypothetical protein
VRALPSDNQHWSVLEQLPIRDKVFFVETIIKEHPLALSAADFPLAHHFLPGMYLRDVHVRKGMLTIGKIHKHPCANFLIKGDRSTVVGDRIVRVKAPYMDISPAGTKRITYTHEDSVWRTAHLTTETDIEKLEHDLVAETEQEYEEFCRMVEAETHKCLS